MTDTPEDIRAKATRIVGDIDADWAWDGQVWPPADRVAQQMAIEAVAQALMEERERCAAAVSEKLEHGRQALCDYGKDPYWEGFSASAFMALSGIRTP